MLRARLFGAFQVWSEGDSPIDLRVQKARELLAYLLLHAKRAHRREALASVLWGETPTAQSKKYLRQALWQLQRALRPHNEAADGNLLLITADYVQMNPDADLWTDIAAFEATRAAAQGRPGESFDTESAHLLEEASDLYRGELLDGWYSDWLLNERDHLQENHLRLLEKLLAYYVARDNHEKGIACAVRILSFDRARVTAHRELMAFYHRNGDRAAALRQYAQCASALADELNIEPSAETVALRDQIRRDRPLTACGGARIRIPAAQPSSLMLPEIVDRLQRAKQFLSDLHDQVQRDIDSIERLLPLPTRSEMNGTNRARATSVEARQSS
jgi:DNA-binding SARP family transcriptional activator